MKSGMETEEMKSEMEIATDILVAMLQRPDARLFSPDELADEAFKYAEALGRRNTRNTGTEKSAPGNSSNLHHQFAALTKASDRT